MSAQNQEVKIGDTIKDECGDLLTCTGYCVTCKDATGNHFITTPVWWNEVETCWEMPHPTNTGTIQVPKELRIEPHFKYL